MLYTYREMFQALPSVYPAGPLNLISLTADSFVEREKVALVPFSAVIKYT